MCRTIFSAMLISLFSCQRASILFSGTYTQEDKSGIHVFSLHNSTGGLQQISQTQGIQDPSYLALSKNKKFLYAVNELQKGSGGISAFSFDKKTAKLTLLNQIFSDNNIAPCHIALDQSNKFACIANYGSGNIQVYALAKDGTVLPTVQHIQLPAVNGKKSHAHQVVFTQNNKHLYINDLGSDRLYQYAFDAKAKKPVGNSVKTFQLPEGYGPRHLALGKDEHFLYLLNEWMGVVNVFDLNNLSTQPVQSIASTAIVNKNDKNKGSAAIRISADGRFLYTSNRGITNNIAIFKIAVNGLLTRVGEQPTDAHPRDFIIENTGKYLLVAARDSNTIKTYIRNKKTGLLSYSGQQTNISKPVALLQY